MPSSGASGSAPGGFSLSPASSVARVARPMQCQVNRGCVLSPRHKSRAWTPSLQAAAKHAPCNKRKGALVVRHARRTGSVMMFRTPLACRGAERCCSPSRAGVPRGASSAAAPASPLTSTALRATAHCTHRQQAMCLS